MGSTDNFLVSTSLFFVRTVIKLKKINKNKVKNSIAKKVKIM